MVRVAFIVNPISGRSKKERIMAEIERRFTPERGFVVALHKTTGRGDATLAAAGFARECYDIVVANILADVLVPLTPVICHQLKKGGIYITSGIIDDKEQTVVQAVQAAGLTVLEVTYQGEWVSVTARRD